MSLLVADRLRKVYPAGDGAVTALDDVSVSLDRGELVAVVGPSGCGKSTLLHICGAMERPTAGTVTVEGRRLERADDVVLTAVRRERIGFVFQFFNLLPTLTLVENVALPLLLSGAPPAAALEQARQLAGQVGVAHRLDHYPGQLSGGELQRAAIARALVHGPALVVADEPTGNLDSENGAAVLALLRELSRERGVGLLLATHAADVAAQADRVIRLKDGRVAGGFAELSDPQT